MRSILSRTAAVAAALVVAAPAAAGAAVPEYAAEASTSSVRIAAFPDANPVSPTLLDLVSTDAFAASDPVASANVGALEVLGEQVFTVVEADSDGELVRDPAEGDGCVLDIPSLEGVCAVASADAGASDEASANATTQLLELGVDGDLLIGALNTPIGDLVANVGDLVVEGATAEFLAQCNEVIATVNGAVPITQTARDLLAMTPEQLEPVEDQITQAVQDADTEGYCSAVLNLTAGDITDALPGIEGILAALPTEGLIDLDVDGAVSDVAGTGDAMTATATQTTVTLSGVDLGSAELDAAIVAVVDAIVLAVEALAEVDLPEAPEQLDLEAIFDQIPLFEIAGPLFAGTVFGGLANATLDNGDSTTTSSGERPYVELAIAPGILELLGQDPESSTVRLEAGQTQTIAEGTPLESTISVGDFQTEDGVEFGDTGLTGSTATASATSVSLLSIPDAGGVEIALAESTAGVYAASVTAGSAPPPDQPLPYTGGGAAVAAVVALGAGLALRRRRD